MHSRNRLMVFSLFVLAINTPAQCAPTLQKLSIYDKLVELSSQQCTYLQHQLLDRDELQFLKKVNVDDVHNITLSIDNMMKIHSVMFMETYTKVCRDDKPASMHVMITEHSIKNFHAYDLKDICGELIRFYTVLNSSEIAKVMLKEGGCRRMCLDLNSEVVPACSVSGLLAQSAYQMMHQPVPEIPSADNIKTVVDSHSQQLVVKNDSTVITNVLTKPLKVEATVDVKKQDKKNSLPEHIIVKPAVSAHEEVQANVMDVQTADGSSENAKIKVIDPLSQNTMSTKIEATQTEVEYSPENAPTDNKSQTTVSKQIAPKNETNKPESPSSNDPNKTTKILDTSDKDVLVEKTQKAASTVSTTTEYAQLKDDNYDKADDFDDITNEINKETASSYNKMPAEKPNLTNGVTSNDMPDGDSSFFSYFMLFCILFVVGYVGYHNKQKILALMFEGRRGRRQQRRRPNTANYHKLDSNLEEAVTSSCDKTTSNVIY